MTVKLIKSVEKHSAVIAIKHVYHNVNKVQISLT
jgi:hypothetical protein